METRYEKKDVYQVITDIITAKLEAGLVPWQMPWSKVLPSNLTTLKPYQGINSFLLNMLRAPSPYWVTYNQADKLGGHVKKGAKGVPVIFWKWLETKTPTGRIDADGKPEMEGVPCLKYYTVFNLSDTEGLKAPETSENVPFRPIESAENIVLGYQGKPEIVHGTSGAWYQPKLDVISMPSKADFRSPEEYYSTLFHEMTHSTGNAKRLNRSGVTDLCPFGSTNYSKEELVAEMGAAFLCGIAGIENNTIDNSAAYIKNWLKRLKDDKKLVILAAAQAQKAAQFIQKQEVK